MDKLEKTGLPFAPIAKPEQLFDDPHLAASGGLLPITVTDGERKGQKTRLPALPLEMGGHRFGVHRDVPRAGQHTREVLAEAGYTAARNRCDDRTKESSARNSSRLTVQRGCAAALPSTGLPVQTTVMSVITGDRRCGSRFAP